MWLSPRGLGQCVIDRVVFVKTALAQGSREAVCVLFVLFRVSVKTKVFFRKRIGIQGSIIKLSRESERWYPVRLDAAKWMTCCF